MVLEHQRFRLLTEYYSFLYWNKKQTLLNFREEFPSPCGVLFILIRIRKRVSELERKLEFPSPCGVSFILI